MKELLSQYELGTIVVRYYIETDTKNVGLILLPEGRVPETAAMKHCSVEPLV